MLPKRTRRRAREFTQSIPVDIWHECFTHLPTSDHKRLSLTCLLFNEIGLSFVFRSITYTCYISLKKRDLEEVSTEMLDDLQRNIIALKAFANSPKHAPLIKKRIKKQWRNPIG
ncbi:hypothetical protein CPB84DRAFT_830523 [Gymnopilus junonius]|uniref:F-box domain-containing protein n=1 Tax=Gymnopilus junonius TaxID=109634 RepID=A0A9P5TPZ6_GYMJU|nr:hypothetical protein CPB84DRAFT_830523 [Gymnopilus junonius]